MTNEEFQKSMLEKLGNLEAGQKELKDKFSDSTGQLNEDISNVKNQLMELKEDISNVKGQLNENTQIIKALLHRTEELDAKFDGLLTTAVTKEAIANLATKEDIENMNAKIDTLNTRLFYQETELTKLKAVK